jgi:hypothetical protein
VPPTNQVISVKPRPERREDAHEELVHFGRESHADLDMRKRCNLGEAMTEGKRRIPLGGTICTTVRHPKTVDAQAWRGGKDLHSRQLRESSRDWMHHVGARGRRGGREGRLTGWLRLLSSSLFRLPSPRGMRSLRLDYTGLSWVAVVVVAGLYLQLLDYQASPWTIRPRRHRARACGLAQRCTYM